MLVLVVMLVMAYSSDAFSALPSYLTCKTTWAEETLKSLTLQEKIGQLFIVAAASKSASEQPETLASSMQDSPYTMGPDFVKELIEKYHIGGVIFLYKSDPETQMKLTSEFQKLSKIPLFIAQDCEWGLSMRLDLDPTKVVRYPRNMTLGALSDEKLIYQLGYEIGTQCAVLGIHINFAPVADVNNNPENPVIHDRSFGDNPKRVARLALLFTQGLHDAGILACAKHFPGHGDTNVDSHLALPKISHSRERLNTVELIPFKQLITSGIGALMNAHLFVPTFDATPNRPSSLSHTVVTEELKNNLGFKGLIFTDGLGMQAITKYFEPGHLELQAFLAGNDILLCPLNIPQAMILIEEAIKNGRISEAELNERVLKILKAKEWAFEKQNAYKKIDPQSYITRPEAYALQTQAYQNAITLVKNSSNLLFNTEIITKSCIIQIGQMPENIFNQECKKYNHNTHLYNKTISDQELQACLNSAQNTDAVIIAVGSMNKSAQDKFGIADTTFKLIAQLKKMNKIIIIVIFGTPYSITLFGNADVIIEAYEDAVPAQKGVVHVLCGTMQPQGKLPIRI
jgi:beta-N-acetylhexosaminidase